MMALAVAAAEVLQAPWLTGSCQTAQSRHLPWQNVSSYWQIASAVGKLPIMDETDRALIRLLRDNARQSVSALAAACHVSRGTVQNRLDRLLRDGVVQGFTIRQPTEAILGQVRAVTLLEVGGGRLPLVVRALRGLPEVAELHTTNGRWDLIVDLAADSLAAFDAVLRRIRLIDGITNSETSLKLSDKI